MKETEEREQDVRSETGHSQNEEGERCRDTEQECPRDQAVWKILLRDQGGPQVNEDAAQGKAQKRRGDGQGGEMVPHEDREQPREGQFVQQDPEAQEKDGDAEVVLRSHWTGPSHCLFSIFRPWARTTPSLAAQMMV